MKTIIVAAVCFVAGLAVQQEPDQLAFDFDPPGFTTEGAGTVFMHFMPPTDGFAANVNLLAQPYEGTLAEYDLMSQRDLERIGFQVVRAENRDGVLIYEYTGQQQGVKLHWYAKAYQTDGMIYLITATALADKWADQSDELIASVDSFVLK